MVAFINRLYGMDVNEMIAGNEFEIPNAAPKYFANLAYRYGDGTAGTFVEKLEYTPYMGWEVYSWVTYYKAVAPGYDVFGFTMEGSGTTFDFLIKVVGSDGAQPVSSSPVSEDDHLTFSFVNSGAFSMNAILYNDHVSMADIATNIEMRPLSDNVVSWVMPNYDVDAELGFYSMDGEPIIGTKVLEYRISDLTGQWGNWAKVFVDFIGLNTSRDHIEASETADTIDFSQSSIAVGVYGLGGDDIIRGSQAEDKLNGDDGADRIGGKGGDDIINGGNGNDTIFGDAGNDTIDGGADNDTLWGGDGNDIIRGGLGNDQIYGDAGDDQVGGKAGNDAVHGGAGNDTIWGDDGNDALYGDAGNDNLNGGAGNDFLTGGLGIDRMRGETGIDTFILMRGEAQGDTILDFEGAGVFGGDKIEFRGYGAGATVYQVSGDTWQIDAAGISETFKIAGVTNLAKIDFYFT